MNCLEIRLLLVRETSPLWLRGNTGPTKEGLAWVTSRKPSQSWSVSTTGIMALPSVGTLGGPAELGQAWPVWAHSCDSEWGACVQGGTSRVWCLAGSHRAQWQGLVSSITQQTVPGLFAWCVQGLGMGRFTHTAFSLTKQFPHQPRFTGERIILYSRWEDAQRHSVKGLGIERGDVLGPHY